MILYIHIDKYESMEIAEQLPAQKNGISRPNSNFNQVYLIQMPLRKV